MKFFTIFAAFSLAFSVIQSARVNSEIDIAFNEFKVNFNKNYVDDAEESERKRIFIENLKFIEEHNDRHRSGESSYSMAVNKFADMTYEEFNSKYGSSRLHFNPLDVEKSFESSQPVPDSIDWTTMGYVTPVKEQLGCVSDWAFAAVTAIEGQKKKISGKLIEHSAQNLIDCSQPEGNHGCSGGDVIASYEYVVQNDGIESESSYPYEYKQGNCRFNVTKAITKLFGYVTFKSGDEDNLKIGVALSGPVAVGIDASHKSFIFYDSGIYDETACSSTDLTRAVAIVGYGTDNGLDFWKVKNTFGKYWGENGYIRMSRNKNNQCGIATKATFPLV